MSFENKSQSIATLVIPVENNLHLQEENGQVVVSSRVVAERFIKRHSDVVRAIENKIALFNENNLTQNCVQYFMQSNYKDDSGKSNKEYLLTRDGFTFIVMGFTGTEADKWKLKYIEAFNKMEKCIKKNNNLLEGISPELQAIIMQDKKLQQIEHKVTELEDNIHITRSQQKQLKKFVNEVIVKVLGGKCAPAYKELSHKAYSEFWNAYYNALNVASYLDTPKKDFHLALKFVNDWVPSRDLALMIRGANSMEVAE